jgi:hypothetical protein
MKPMMKTPWKWTALALTAALAACGGGGGSSGTVSAPYQISLSSERSQLPINIASAEVGIGVYAPYTTTLTVSATVGGGPIPGGEEIFSCALSGALGTGVLYYLDGKDEHQDPETKKPLAFRSIVLPSNAGRATFHFHAGNQAGPATVTCSVDDPRDKQRPSATTIITVGAATGKVASINGLAAYPVLGVQGNASNLRTSTAIEAFALDDANQPVSSLGKANIQVRLAGGSGAAGARLFAGSQSGGVVQLQATGGVGLFSLSSGTNEGPILLEMTTDRRDNDVTNGIQDPVTGFLVMTATAGTTAEPGDPLALVTTSLPNGVNGIPYSQILTATGGTAPYTWTALGSLPAGLTLSSSGLVSGTPNMAQPGTVQLAVRVTDSGGRSVNANLAITIAGTTGTDPLQTPLSINLPGCGSDVNTACALPDAPVGSDYLYALTATGAGTGVAAWSTSSTRPGWLAFSNEGVLEGTVPVACGALSEFFITVTKGGQTIMRKVSIKGVTGPGGVCP